MEIENRYISLCDIFKYGTGFLFFNKHNVKFKVYETKTKTLPEEFHGIFCDNLPYIDYMTVVSENGKILEFSSGTFDTVGIFKLKNIQGI